MKISYLLAVLLLSVAFAVFFVSAEGNTLNTYKVTTYAPKKRKHVKRKKLVKVYKPKKDLKSKMTKANNNNLQEYKCNQIKARLTTLSNSARRSNNNNYNEITRYSVIIIRNSEGKLELHALKNGNEFIRLTKKKKKNTTKPLKEEKDSNTTTNATSSSKVNRICNEPILSDD
ncbi:hypothetical protein ABK040_004143 [Willaertia magna]